MEAVIPWAQLLAGDHRAALPQGRTRPPAHRPGADAARLFALAVVWAGRRGGRRGAGAHDDHDSQAMQYQRRLVFSLVSRLSIVGCLLAGARGVRKRTAYPPKKTSCVYRDYLTIENTARCRRASSRAD
jgi:hypothetical protein